jgi:pimeloyl-ACP methyl ester carboxylesterase
MASQDFFIPGRAGRLALRTRGLDTRPAHVAVLVQGANLTGQAGYDFQVPGRSDYSLMDLLAARGIGTVTFSIRGYGASDAPPDPLGIDTDAAIEDLATVMDWARAQGHERPHLAGWSWGGRITARYVEQHPERVDRLALLDPALGGTNLIPPDPTEAQAWWSGDWKFWYERLEVEFTEEAARRALADYVVAHEPRSPNGIRRENARGSIAARAAAITRPTLMIYGHAAARQNYMQGGVPRLKFFEDLATQDKAFVLVPGGGDYCHLQKPRVRFASAIADFLLAS